MTWKEKRIVTILGSILAVLMAALLIVLSLRYRAQWHAEENAAIVTTEGEVIDQTAFTELHLRTNSTSLRFALNEEGKWVWADDAGFPLNDETVLKILAIVEDPKPQQTLPMEGGPEAYALESPVGTVEAIRGNGEVKRIDLGKTTTDGKSYYAMLDNGVEQVYIIPDTLYHLLETPIYSMCLPPKLPDLRPERLSSLIVRSGSGDSLRELTIQQSNGRWTTADGTDVTEHEQFQALLEDAADLQVEKCLDYAPSDSASEICGLTAPAAELVLSYLDENEAEQTFILTVGKHVPSGDGRYVRLNGGEPIYFLPAERLDPLMRIAAQGLS